MEIRAIRLGADRLARDPRPWWRAYWRMPLSLRARIADPDLVVTLAPEELASQILTVLGPIRPNINQGLFNRDRISAFAAEYPRRQDEIEIAITEAWRWLELNLFIVPAPGTRVASVLRTDFLMG
jgi:hypothetical protein